MLEHAELTHRKQLTIGNRQCACGPQRREIPGREGVQASLIDPIETLDGFFTSRCIDLDWPRDNEPCVLQRSYCPFRAGATTFQFTEKIQHGLQSRRGAAVRTEKRLALRATIRDQATVLVDAKERFSVSLWRQQLERI